MAIQDRKYQLNQRLEVEFDDIHVDSSWLEYEDAMKVPTGTKCRCVGYYLTENDNFLIMSSMIDNRKKGNRDRHTIPKGTIRKIRKLKIER